MSFESAQQKVADKSTIRANHAFFEIKQNDPKTNPTNENNNPAVNLRFGNFPIYPAAESNLSSKDATATYPLKTTSRACPFGGARHTCPTKIQTKLTINQPGDIYEQEADQIAEQAISMLDSFPIDNDTIDRKCADCETNDDEEKKDLNFSRKPSNTSNLKTDEKITSEISSIRSGGGSPLEATTKEFMESRFGYDFSTVRIHSDLSAARTAKALNALAYTTGNDVTFGEGQYSPNTVKGRRLLAHELTHIIQQGTKVKFDEGVIQRQSSPKANPYAGSDKEEAWQQGYKDCASQSLQLVLRSPDSYTPDQQQAYQEGSQAANVVSINTETPASAPSTSESRLLAEPPIVVAPPPVPAGHSISPPPPVSAPDTTLYVRPGICSPHRIKLHITKQQTQKTLWALA